jgi:mannose-1-phosphate guanylyltransferase / mannose-6-phosphate isomerase
MMTMKNVAVILCGGSGSRLWPLSRQAQPKQFHAFVNGISLLAQTVQRANQLTFIDHILIVSGSAHQHLLRAHVAPHTDKPVHYLLEPIARNTAAAIACAAHYIKLHICDAQPACMIVMPSDHYMTNMQAFSDSIEQAIIGARLGRLMTFGVKPTSPETGYGYIQRGQSLAGTSCHEVARFVEKPNLVKAQEMINNPDYAWNSGIFVFDTHTLLAEMDQFEPQISESSQAAVGLGALHNDFFSLHHESLQACPSNSIDYAVLEKSQKIAVATMQASWSDLGSWSAVAELSSSGSQASQSQPVISINSGDNYIHAQKTVAIVGLSDLVVIDTPDALLVAHKQQSQQVKQVVDQISKSNPAIAQNHTKVQRPWGSYESLHHGQQHQVKYIEVQPGGQLSLQSHNHRAEHWVVVSGAATVTVGSETKLYKPGEHIYIKIQQKHRLENFTSEKVGLIEVQIGGYLGEDDIIRYSDVYGRTALTQ